MARARRPAYQVEELGARLLYSADLAPLAMQLQQPALVAFALPVDDECVAAAPASHAAEQSRALSRHEIVFVDAAVGDAERLLADWMPDGRTVEVIRLDAGSDGVDQISQALAGRQGVAALHIVSHGAAGALQLGTGTLDALSLALRAEQIARWGDSLAGDADLLLYGCDVARGDAGGRFVADLALLTGADVAASDDASGGAAAGGDWDLEWVGGSIEARGAFDAALGARWDGRLAITAAGTETLVNTTTASVQATTLSTRQVAMDAAGNYVVVWQDSNNTDGSWLGAFGQRYDAAGVARGGQFQINTFFSGAQEQPEVAMAPDGSFVVAWMSHAQDGDNWGVYAKRYDSAGVAQGSEFHVSAVATVGSQNSPTVAIDASGRFVIAWVSNDAGGNPGIFAQRYDATGVAQGGSFQVNTHVANTQSQPALAMDAAGNFVVTWESEAQDGSAAGIYAQRYDMAGVAQGAEFRVTTTTFANQEVPAIAMDATGKFVIAWADQNLDGNGRGVYARIFGDTGVAIGAEFRVNTTTAGDQLRPMVALRPSGGFIVAWQSNAQDGDGQGIYFRQYDAAGAALGGETAANTTTAGAQQAASVAIDDLGHLVVVWSGNGSGDATGVFAQRFAYDVPTPVITSNGGGATAAINLAENSAAVSTVTATAGASYAIAGGVDAARFTIDAGTGALAFVSAPDFESPTDANGNNTYHVTVSVSDGSGGIDYQAITVSVTDLAYNVATVTTTADTADGDTSSIGALLQNRGADGEISLREAIVAANNTASESGGVDRIGFGIAAAPVGGVHSITLGAALPSITDTVVIDGTLEPDFAGTPMVVIDGASAGAVANGLQLGAGSGGSTIRGLVVRGFGQDGILIASGNNTIAGNVVSGNAVGVELAGAGAVNNLVQGNFIGLAADGLSALGNSADGIRIQGGASGNTIGGTAAGAGNVISGNTNAAISINGAGSDGNVVQGNIVGLSADGSAARANFRGVFLSGSTHTTIGGATAAAGNVISGNDRAIEIENESTDGTTIQNNLIGVGADGVTARGNNHGIVIGAGADDTLIGGVGRGNVIAASSAGGGIRIDGASTGTTIRGNFIGTDASGSVDLGSQGAGVQLLNGAAGTAIGGTGAGEGNVIAFNGKGGGTDIHGIDIQGSGTGNAIHANRIFSNAGSGINLGASGVTANDAGDGDAGANNLQNFPVLTSSVVDAAVVRFIGTLSGSASTGFRIEFFASASEDGTGHGEGERHLGFVNVSTDGSGNAGIDATLTAAVVAGERISATATNLITNDTSEFAQNVTVRTAPIITSGGGGAAAGFNQAENTTVVTTVAATDPDVPAFETLTYNIAGGVDAAAFTIDANTGTLSFVSAPDHETPTDANADGAYLVTVQVSDGSGGADSQSISVTVTDANDAPIIASHGGGAAAAVNILENSTAVATVSATDADLPTPTLVYSVVGGVDAARFMIDASTGELRFAAAPDFEAPSDAGGDNVYDVTVLVDDGAGGTDTQSIAVTVTAANDNSPIIAGGAAAAVNVVENGTTVTTVSATDADLPTPTLVYSISGGADAARFTIDVSTGVLTFAVPPDFEAPMDAGRDNVYDVTVQVDDGAGGADTQAVSVTVTPVNVGPDIGSGAAVGSEPPSAPAAPPAAVPPATVPPPAAAEPIERVPIGARASTPDAEGDAAAELVAPLPRFAHARSGPPVETYAVRGAAVVAGASGSTVVGGSPATEAPTVQLVVDLQLEVTRQRLDMAPITVSGARALAAGDLQPAVVDGEPSMEDAARRLALDVDTLEAAGLTLSLGLVWWAVRIAGVAGSLLVSLPAWSTLDPLPILGAQPDDDDEATGLSSYSPDSGDEDAVAEVLARHAGASHRSRP
jgi:CSLREA domain-containing protein